MIRLKKFEEPDYDRLIHWVDNKKLLVNFSGQIFDLPITHKQLDKYVSDSARIVYKVIEIKTNVVIGHAELNAINYRSSTLEFAEY